MIFASHSFVSTDAAQKLEEAKTQSNIERKELETVEDHVRHQFIDAPVMVQVAKCESRFRQTREDGSLLRGNIDPRDVGVMQINEYYHLDTAEKLGINIHTLEGNLAYARYLYEKEGTTPWMASSKCWGIGNHIARK